MTASKTVRFTLALAVACALPLFAGRALADAKTDKDIEERFKAADKDHDGKLTLAEAKAGMPRIAKGFDKIDKDKKGFLTVEQIKAFAANQ
ncbi:MAG TPA: EF-hand domain-containing protein [Pseudomonadota bacterium]|nr:EF-hand domain-containing protein [Pseudomonadota bacterium]